MLPLLLLFLLEQKKNWNMFQQCFIVCITSRFSCFKSFYSFYCLHAFTNSLAIVLQRTTKNSIRAQIHNTRRYRMNILNKKNATREKKEKYNNTDFAINKFQWIRIKSTKITQVDNWERWGSLRRAHRLRLFIHIYWIFHRNNFIVGERWTRAINSMLFSIFIKVNLFCYLLFHFFVGFFFLSLHFSLPHFFSYFISERAKKKGNTTTFIDIVD